MCKAKMAVMVAVVFAAGVASVGAQKEKPAAKTPPPAPAPAIAPFDAKKAKEHQAAWAKYLGVPVEMTDSIGIKFMLIPPGEFDMGSSKQEAAKLLEQWQGKAPHELAFVTRSLAAETPQHRVRITKAFYLGRCEVTQAQYEKVMGENPSKYAATGTGKKFVVGLDTSAHPVDRASWNDATAFCRKLNELPQEQAAHAGYRLPTEAEWEYGCRAGTTTRWYWGDDEAAKKNHAWMTIDGVTHPVGQLSPNPWGLYDMHGNVVEWCQDFFGREYYATSKLDDPPGPAAGVDRVCRGGCWHFNTFRARSSFRDAGGPDLRHDGRYGFRLVRSVKIQDRSQ